MKSLPFILAKFLALLSVCHGQPLAILKNFGESLSDGAVPAYYGALVGDTYFGVTTVGGANGVGTLYSINTDGSSFTVIRNFTESEGKVDEHWDGVQPALIHHEGRIHGILQDAVDDTSPVQARLFSLQTDGSDFRIDKEISDGEPVDLGNGNSIYRNEGDDLALHFIKDGFLYGIARSGAAPETAEWQQGFGGIFRVRPGGADYAVLHRFTDLLNGRRPVCLVDGGEFLYGVCLEGGPNNRGVIFKLRPDGTDFAILKNLLISDVGSNYGVYLLRYHNAALYFMSGGGGRNADGVVFTVDPGSGAMNRVFDFGDAPSLYSPEDFLVGDDGIFGLAAASYGAADGGIFRLNTNGSGFRELVAFDGAAANSTDPQALVRHSGRLYGLLKSGGSQNAGALFSFDPTSAVLPKPPDVPPPFPKSAKLTGMSTSGQPPMARWNHSVLWTGNRFVVWGGVANGTTVATGGIYNPETDAWITTSSVGAPAARAKHTAVWDDKAKRMIIWGGVDGGGKPLGDGFSFDPEKNQWTALPATGAPTARSGHTAVWTGMEMIIWGGSEGQRSGAIYNPETSTWRPMGTDNAPLARVGHGAVWAGTRMAVWGGSVGGLEQINGTGAFYDPVSDSWEEIVVGNAPSGGYGELADDSEAKAVQLLWTGKKLLAFPLNNQSGDFWIDAGLYDPARSSWERIGTAGAPKVRPYMVAWLGSTLFVAGSSGTRFQGSVYDFELDRWKTLVTATTGSFQGRQGAWADGIGEFLVFGGRWADGQNEFSGGANGQRGFRIEFEGLVAPIEWTWAKETGNRRIELGETTSFGVELSGPGGFTYQWFKDGKLIRGATTPSLDINANTPAAAGRYHVEITSRSDKKIKVTTPGLKLVVTDPGLLIYSFRGREIFSDSAGEETLQIGGYFLVDRDNRRATDIVVDRKAKKFRVNASPDGNGGSPFAIRVFSTGPLPQGTRSTFSYIDTGRADASIAWYTGQDKLVSLDQRNSVVAPATLLAWAGQGVEDTATDETYILNWSFSMTLDRVQTLRARASSFETLQQAADRIRAELTAQGLTEK
jgi:hypothetical protein